MVVNFRVCGISQGARKMTRTTTLIIIKKNHAFGQTLDEQSITPILLFHGSNLYFKRISMLILITKENGDDNFQ